MIKLVTLLAIFGLSYSHNEGPKHYHHSVSTSYGKKFNTTLITNEPTICDPNVQQYSGYLDAGTGNKYFYWFFEARNNPTTAPLIMWLTGGPGCSSQLALLVENGPCYVNKDGKTTVINQNSWNTNANIMWVDQPPNTGFSTGRDDTTEYEIAEDMWAFLQNFIKTYPQYFKHGFYVIGESYGGHYVPNVANYIYSQNVAGAGTNIPLEGFGIGNGLTDPYIQFAYYAEMAYNSSTAINSPYSKIPISKNLYTRMTSEIPTCQKDILACNNKLDNTDCDDAYNYCLSNEVSPVTNTGVNPYNLDIPCEYGNLCYDFTPQTNYLNEASVQQQLGVNKKWNSCNTQVNIRLEADWMKDYQQNVTTLINNGVRGLIYAGDLDFICNYLGNQAWAIQLPWNGQKQFDAATPIDFNVNGKAAGKLRQGQGIKNFTFLQVYQAGHMVPMDQPAVALSMVDAFLANAL